MATVEIPMVMSAATSVALRPTLSPKWPNNAPPMGRAKNAIAKVAKDWRSAELPSLAGKNRCGNTITAAVA